MSSGERPIGTAKGKQSNTEALCHPPPPLWGLRARALWAHSAVLRWRTGGRGDCKGRGQPAP